MGSTMWPHNLASELLLVNCGERRGEPSQIIKELTQQWNGLAFISNHEYWNFPFEKTDLEEFEEL